MSEPKPIGELISALAQQYDPELEADGMSYRAFAQGMMVGSFLKEPRFLKIRDLETPRDANGDYENYFVVITEDGRHRIRVTVELES